MKLNVTQFVVVYYWYCKVVNKGLLLWFFFSKAKYAAEQAAMENETQFSVSQQEQSSKGTILDNATDIKVNDYFLLSAN